MRDRTKVWRRVGRATLALGLAGWLCWAVIDLVRETHAQREYLPKQCLRYRIRMGTPYITMEDGWREVAVFAEVAADSPLTPAGLRQGDVLLRPSELGRFARLLRVPTGDLVSFEVVSRDDLGDEDPATRRTIRLRAP